MFEDAAKTLRLTRAGAAVILAVAGSVLIGWMFDVGFLKSMLPGYIEMKANTAVAFGLAGAGVLLLTRKSLGRFDKSITALFSLLVILIGAATIFEYIGHADLGIDQLLFRDRLQIEFPGRLAPVTAVNFVISGCALLLLSGPQQRWKWAQILGAGTTVSALLAIIGYSYGVPLLYGSSHYTSMALHTGVSFLFLGMVILGCRPTVGFMTLVSSSHRGGWLLRRLLPAAILVPFLLGGFFIRLTSLLGNVRLAIASIIVCQIILFVVLSWWLTYRLDRSEEERVTTKQALSRSEEMLRQAQKMEAMGQLAGGVAHDFNNLLSVILGYGDLLISSPETSPDSRRQLEKIVHAGESAASLTRQLLAFSRQQLLQPKVLSLNHVVTKMDGILHRLVMDNIHLSVALSATHDTVEVDQGQVEQILVNLVVNASDAMPKGGMIEVRTCTAEVHPERARKFGGAPGDYVQLSVTDTGSGIPPEVLDRIFEPFFTTKPMGKGTGLGLATVHGIVKQSGGFVEVESKRGVGSTFHIWLPLVKRAQGGTAAAKPQSSTLARGETILVAEDAETLRELMCGVLRDRGYKVLEASDGLQAEEFCRHHPEPIHLLVTDLIMPFVSGRDLMEVTASMRRDMKVLVMSGYTNDTIAQQGILKSEIAFMHKPFVMSDLVSRVREVLDAPQPKASALAASSGQSSTIHSSGAPKRS